MQRTISTLALASCTLAAASSVLANAGTLLPLDQYQAGTEVVDNSIVTNGGFELEGSAPNLPAGWTAVGPATRSAPVGLNTSAVNGSYTAKLGTSTGLNKFTQEVTVQPNTAYYLSGYIWNYGLENDIVQVEIMDPADDTPLKNFSLQIGQGAPGDLGHFGYAAFNGSFFGGLTTLKIEVEFDPDENIPGVRPEIAAQIDNIALTPNGVFVEPQLIPEPASLSLLAIGAAGLLRRRRI